MRQPNEKRGPVFTWMSDVPQLTERERLMAESAYRRGFYQGYMAATDDRIHGSTLKRCVRFLSGVLYKWMINRHDGSRQPPPRLS